MEEDQGQGSEGEGTDVGERRNRMTRDIGPSCTICGTRRCTSLRFESQGSACKAYQSESARSLLTLATAMTSHLVRMRMTVQAVTLPLTL